jgi:hypothetical protein
MLYTPANTKTGAQTKTSNQPKFMKTNTKFILTMIAISAIAIIATTKIDVSYLPATVSYVAVAMLLALAAADYRVGSKSNLAR